MAISALHHAIKKYLANYFTKEYERSYYRVNGALKHNLLHASDFTIPLNLYLFFGDWSCETTDTHVLLCNEGVAYFFIIINQFIIIHIQAAIFPPGILSYSQ